MRIRIPTLRLIESKLKSYGLQALTGVVASLGIFFQDSLVDFVAQAPSQTLATIVVWLAIAVIALVSVGAVYIIKSQALEKAVLSFDPNYYAHHEFNEAFVEFTKDS